MDPLTLVVVAVALGASEGARETAKNVVTDSYAALKQYITRRYASVTADLEGVESEPEEELRRQLLAKKLDQAGAAGDQDLQQLAQVVVDEVAEHAPGAAAIVGVQLTRVAVGGHVTITDVSVEGGSGVTAEDVSVGGNLTIGGVNARSGQEPPHPLQARQ